MYMYIHINPTIVIICTYTQNIPGVPFDTVQVYDTVSDTWETSKDEDTELLDMEFDRGGMGNAVYYDGRIYIFGGETDWDNYSDLANANGTFDIVDIYDIENNSWSRGESMIYARHGMFPVLYENAIYIAAGGGKVAYSHSDHFTKYCLSPDIESQGSDDDVDWYMVAAIAGPIIALILVIIIFRCWCKRREKSRQKLGDMKENVPLL